MSKSNVVTKSSKNKSTTNSATAPSVIGYMVSQSGKRYEVTNVADFSRRFRLDCSAVNKVLRGDRNIHKNWRRG